MLEAYIDGGCAPKNPGGTASYGVIVLGEQLFKEPFGECIITSGGYRPVIWQDCGIIGTGPDMSNNVGEYGSLSKLLDWLDNQPVEDITIYSDSQLVVNQMSGSWLIKKGSYKPYAEDCLNWLTQNSDMWSSRIRFKWIPREENLADRLTVEALNEVGITRRSK